MLSFSRPSSSPPRGGWGGGSSGKLYSFSSSLRRARIHSSTENLEEDEEYVGNVNQSNDDVGGTHIEYEIVCRLSIRSQEELVWSVWRRYSAFKLVDEKLRKAYGWQIDALNDGWGLRFPGGHAVYVVIMERSGDSSERVSEQSRSVHAQSGGDDDIVNTAEERTEKPIVIHWFIIHYYECSYITYQYRPDH